MMAFSRSLILKLIHLKLTVLSALAVNLSFSFVFDFLIHSVVLYFLTPVVLIAVLGCILKVLFWNHANFMILDSGFEIKTRKAIVSVPMYQALVFKGSFL